MRHYFFVFLTLLGTVSPNVWGTEYKYQTELDDIASSLLWALPPPTEKGIMIGVAGGGPVGLAAALLCIRKQEVQQVFVFEKGSPKETIGGLHRALALPAFEKEIQDVLGRDINFLKYDDTVDFADLAEFLDKLVMAIANARMDRLVFFHETRVMININASGQEEAIAAPTVENPGRRPINLQNLDILFAADGPILLLQAH